MTNKQLTNFLSKIVQLPLPALEKETMRLYQLYLHRCTRGTERLVEDKIKLCLNERKERLNKDFTFTPENVNQIRQIVEKLKIATQKLLDKTIEINEQMRGMLQSSDSFLHEFSIEATLTVKWEETDNAIDEILDEFAGLPLRQFNANSSNYDTVDTIADKLDESSWNEEELSAPELSEIPYFPYAAHSLFCHSFYSYSDCIAITAFRNDINVRWENIVEIAENKDSIRISSLQKRLNNKLLKMTEKKVEKRGKILNNIENDFDQYEFENYLIDEIIDGKTESEISDLIENRIASDKEFKVQYELWLEESDYKNWEEFYQIFQDVDFLTLDIMQPNDVE